MIREWCPYGRKLASVQMPYTLFGVGTAFIGKRDFGTDDAYVTTEFKTVSAGAKIPIMPVEKVTTP